MWNFYLFYKKLKSFILIEMLKNIFSYTGNLRITSEIFIKFSAETDKSPNKEFNIVVVNMFTQLYNIYIQFP